MPWRIKRLWYFILLGGACISLGLVVLYRDRFGDTRMLAAAAIVGGVAMILNALPSDGGDEGGP